MNRTVRTMLAALAAAWAVTAGAQGNLEVDTPPIAMIKHSMAQRHVRLEPHFASGAIGVARDGSIALRDANVVPLAQRQAVSNLVASENNDRAGLYREIARANGHPEWEAQIRTTFAQRWLDKAQPGWWIQNAAGQWVRK